MVPSAAQGIASPQILQVYFDITNPFLLILYIFQMLSLLGLVCLKIAATYLGLHDSQAHPHEVPGAKVATPLGANP